MKIFSIEVQTDQRVVHPVTPFDVEAVGDMPPPFRMLTETLWGRVRTQDPDAFKVKVRSIGVSTDLGRRVVQLGAPMDIDARGDMPPPFRSLTEILWGLLREISTQKIEAPKVEA